MMNYEIEEDAPLARLPNAAIIFSLLTVSAVTALFVFRNVPAGSEVRVRNGTEHAFRQVVVNGQYYGDIDAGQSTEYRNLRVAYRYANVRLLAGSREIRLSPEDYVGETPLGSGKFTYVLNMTGAEQIDLRVEK